MAGKERVPARRKKAKLKPSERTVFFVVERLRCFDPETGEEREVKALVPASGWDRATLNERGIRVGDHLMCDVFKERNARFYRLAHALAKFVRDNVDSFSGLTIHAALKRLQRDANVECDEYEMELDLGPMGKPKVPVRQPRSLNFSDMDDSRFQEVWQSICDHVASTYFKHWNADQVAEAAEMWEDKSQ